MVLIRVDHRLVTAEKTRDSALLGSADEETEGFAPLKAALQAIPAVFADRESVRSQSSCGTSPLTSTFLGNRRCENQDRYPPPTDSNDGIP